MLKRKLYQDMLKWKKERNGRTGLLIQGVKGVGKTTLVEEFAKNEYKSHVIIDFSTNVKQIINLFENGFHDHDAFFGELSVILHVEFYPRDTLIVFDEVQCYPHARELVKHFVEDGRYDFIETGSLISIRKNIMKIVIPSEESKLTLYPLSFEEFLWAISKAGEIQYGFIKKSFESRKKVGILHEKSMKDFRVYMIVGGMPQAVNEYIKSKDFRKVEAVKQCIIAVHMNDMSNLPKLSSKKVIDIYNHIPVQLSQTDKNFNITSIDINAKIRNYEDTFSWLEEAQLINEFHPTCLHNLGYSYTYILNYNRRKIYLNDTGLLVTLALGQSILSEEQVYNSLLFDKLHINKGMVVENVIAQELVFNHHKHVYYYSIEDNKAVEVDFLIRPFRKISPIVFKSSAYTTHSSLDKLRRKLSNHHENSYIIYDKDLMIKNDIIHLPIYMIGLL